MASLAAAPVTALTPARASHGFATTWDSDGESSAPPTTLATPSRRAGEEAPGEAGRVGEEAS